MAIEDGTEWWFEMKSRRRRLKVARASQVRTINVRAGKWGRSLGGGSSVRGLRNRGRSRGKGGSTDKAVTETRLGGDDGADSSGRG